jgi:hypothetical protein
MTGYDARTGAFRQGLEGIPGSFHRLFPLEKGKVAFQFSDSDKPALTVWDASAGGAPKTILPASKSNSPPSVKRSRGTA